MNFENLEIIIETEKNKRLAKSYRKMQALLRALSKKEIPSGIKTIINEDIKLLNSFKGSEKEMNRNLKKTNTKILALVKKELKLVPKNYYLSLGAGIGLVFGTALGTSFISFLNNSTAMGTSLGLIFGAAIGSMLDKRAEKDGKQLDL